MYHYKSVDDSETKSYIPGDLRDDFKNMFIQHVYFQHVYTT
jgi:hypothetical protein